MTIRLPKSIKENLRFLTAEIDSQLGSLQQFFSEPSFAQARRILDRSGYAFNLKTRIHDDAINQLARSKKGSLQRLNLRSAELIATDLDRISELGRDAVKQLQYMDDTHCLQEQQYRSLIRLLRQGVAQVLPAIEDQDSKQGLEIGRLAEQLQQQYQQVSQTYQRDMEQGGQLASLSHAQLVAYAVMQMGQCLMRISESLLSASLGQPVTMERYSSLRSLISEVDSEPEDLQVEPIAETRSGSNISGISSTNSKDKRKDKSADKTYLAIFKDGVKDKVEEERDGVESWHQIYPGLAPKILSYKNQGQSAALLIEHLPGHTFEQLLLQPSDELLDQALQQLGKTLTKVWEQTLTAEPAQANYLTQLKKRLPEVYRIHPEFDRPAQHIGDISTPSLQTLLEQTCQLEKNLSAPFSVYIHGDFNVDNILYDPLEKRINYIDLHRSRYMDYVQDVSVFMVSNYRLQILDTSARQRILQVPLAFYKVARRFARKHKDETFELRLALGLARSFITSTRFILDKSLSRRMMLRAIYILEQVLKADTDKPQRFKLKLEELFVE